jgi:predicted amidohydrolase
VNQHFFQHGKKAKVILKVEGWRFGLSICYDVRFSELYSRYADQLALHMRF